MAKFSCGTALNEEQFSVLPIGRNYLNYGMEENVKFQIPTLFYT